MQELDKVPALKLDFASPTTTIASFAEVDDALTKLLNDLGDALVEKQLRYDLARDTRELEVRGNTAVKLTEGYVTTAVNADPDVFALNEKVEVAKAEIACVKASIASLERKHSLFKNWLATQRVMGLGD